MGHAIIQTVSESMFNKTGLDGTRFFLKTFVDDIAKGSTFSAIASEIHDVRNIVAHQAYSGLQHTVEYFADDIEAGWTKADGVLLINPVRYSLQIEQVFRTSSIYAAFKNLPDKERLLRKYDFIRQWLRLDKHDSITKRISTLKQLDASALSTHEHAIRTELYERYGLG